MKGLGLRWEEERPLSLNNDSTRLNNENNVVLRSIFSSWVLVVSPKSRVLINLEKSVEKTLSKA